MLFKKKQNKKKLEQKIEQLNSELKNYEISKSIQENELIFKQLFINVGTIKYRYVNYNEKQLKYLLIYCEGLVDIESLNDNIIHPLERKKLNNINPDKIEKSILEINGIRKTSQIKEIISSITYGETALFIEGYNEILLLNTQKFTSRGITEPENEKILLGPREGFTEVLLFNVSMLHRKLRTNELKVEFQTIGKRSNTSIAICYLEGIVKPNVLKELRERLNTINIDGILDSNYILELIKDNPLSPFSTIGTTERPDVVAGKLLEGRIAVIVDGTPIVLTLPYIFIENFQSSEDYYMSFYYSSISRLIRIFGFVLTTTIPAIYVSIVAYHHEMIQTALFLNVTMERQSVPLPAAAEAFVMLIIFEILKETGIRMPTGVGQALSIVGALVIGQAAVEAKLVAAPMIIIVGITGITGLLVPRMSGASLVLRFTTLIAASTLGLFGILIACSFWVIHIINLKSFGIREFNFLETNVAEKTEDTFIRLPWKYLKRRPHDIATKGNLIKNATGEKNE